MYTKRLPALLAALALTANLSACQNNQNPPSDSPKTPLEHSQQPQAEIIPAGICYASIAMPNHHAQLQEALWQADEQGNLTLELAVSSSISGDWELLAGDETTILQQQEGGLSEGENQISIAIPAQQAQGQTFFWKFVPEQGEQEAFCIELPQRWEAGQKYLLQDGRFVQPPLRKYMDARSELGRDYDLSRIEKISEDQLRSLSFDQQTVFPETGMPENLTPEQLMEQAMDPGLGVRRLHQQGVTGQGVSVAIIDQGIPAHNRENHPEYAGKFKAYQNLADQEISMHGPAVASLLVGENCGVAPGASLYYVAANSWDGDAKSYADALNWLIDQNKTLPEEEKIRVVSVSAAPGSNIGPFTKNNELWEEARQRALADGMLVLDVTSQSGIQLLRGYGGPETLQDPEKLIAGDPNAKDGPPTSGLVDRLLLVPCSRRTTAGMWSNPEDSQYSDWGVGGLSWGVPYAAGVLALGWQIRPDYAPEQMLNLLIETAAENDLGFPCVDPPAFIAAVQAGTP